MASTSSLTLSQAVTARAISNDGGPDHHHRVSTFSALKSTSTTTSRFSTSRRRASIRQRAGVRADAVEIRFLAIDAVEKAKSSQTYTPESADRNVSFSSVLETSTTRNQQPSHCLSLSKSNSRRRLLLLFTISPWLFPSLPSFAKTKSKNPYDERRLLEQNKRRQRENNVPDEFPNFIREGFEVKVVTSDTYVKRDSGLIYWDIQVGEGDCPKDGQQVTFHYVGYNESGRRIDSTYLQGSPAKIRLGNNALVPGFEEGIRDMRPGGKRRMIIPPELGPPVGPSTFFSAKQFEVFDVEMLSIQSCQRRTIGFYSDVICN